MSHRSGGLFRMLERPAAYLALQNLLGGERARRRFVGEYVKPFSHARVLDAGCGTGTLLDYLPREIEYVGFDVNPAYIEAAIAQHGARGRFVCARAGDAVGETEKFDLVVALALLHHLDDADAARLLAQAARVLRPGGAFVSIDAVFHPGQGTISRLLARADRGASVRSPDAYRRLIGVHFEEIDDCVVRDLLRVPYSHYIARACRPHLAK
jgi:SAM-dependent methyltransferase